MPVRGWRLVVERVHGTIMGELVGGEGRELVHKESFGIGRCFNGSVREDGAFVGVVAKDGGDFNKFAGGERADRVIGHKVIVEDRVVGKYWGLGGTGEWLVEVDGLECSDGEGAEAGERVVRGGAVGARDKVIILVLALCYCANCRKRLRLGSGGMKETVITAAVGNEVLRHGACSCALPT